MTGPLHLTQGDHAAALLREASGVHALAGTVFPIPEDLSHGPLDDGVGRLAYFRACCAGFANWMSPHTDAFTPWLDLLARLDQMPVTEIVIWAGDNASEATFLAMACAWLQARPEILSRASPPPSAYTGQCTPAQLASLHRTRVRLDQPMRQSLAEDFVRLRAENAPIRRWENGRVIGVPIDRYDDLLLHACPTAWTPAARLVGTAMAACDPANLMSDLFFSSRLQALMIAGRIAHDKPRTTLSGYSVRLVSNGVFVA